MKSRRWVAAVLALVVGASVWTTQIQAQTAAPRPLPKLRPQGCYLVDGEGQRVVLKGCNVGNWLLLEMWMLRIDEKDLADQYDFENLLQQRFGRAEKDRLMELYREHWITEADFARIRSFGMNCVRLPFHYSLLEDDARPLQLKPDAFKWLDRAVDWAERHGMYTILDLHGAPGGQNKDHTCGRQGQNKLWKSKEYRARTAFLWRELARHFKDRSAVAAYDILNEPYGGEHAEHVAVFDELYRAIREIDKERLIYAASHYDGFLHYGDPRQRGYTGVGFTRHYYPGLFGEDPTPEKHARLIRMLPLERQSLKRWQAPFLSGEFNVVFKRAGGPALMRRYYDLYGEYGWASTMWCYKVYSQGGIGGASWGMVTNKQRLPKLDLANMTKAQIEAYFRSLSTLELEVYEELRAALTSPTPPAVSLPALPPLTLKSPSADPPPPGWQATDINGSLPGGQRILPTGAVELHGGGRDIWAREDQFRFMWRKVRGDFTLTARVTELWDIEQWAKASLMLRANLEKDSPLALINVFPHGGVQSGLRPRADAEIKAKNGEEGKLPNVRLKLERKGARVATWYALGDGAWQAGAAAELPVLAGEAHVGLFALSRDNRQLVKAAFADIEFKKAPPSSHAATNNGQ